MELDAEGYAFYSDDQSSQKGSASGRKRVRDSEAAPRRQKRGGLLAAMQRYVAVRSNDTDIQQVLPKVKVEDLPQLQCKPSTPAGTSGVNPPSASQAGSRQRQRQRSAGKALAADQQQPEQAQQEVEHVLPVVAPCFMPNYYYIQQQQQQQQLSISSLTDQLGAAQLQPGVGVASWQAVPAAMAAGVGLILQPAQGPWVEDGQRASQSLPAPTRKTGKPRQACGSRQAQAGRSAAVAAATAAASAAPSSSSSSQGLSSQQTQARRWSAGSTTTKFKLNLQQGQQRRLKLSSQPQALLLAGNGSSGDLQHASWQQQLAAGGRYSLRPGRARVAARAGFLDEESDEGEGEDEDEYEEEGFVPTLGAAMDGSAGLHGQAHDSSSSHPGLPQGPGTSMVLLSQLHSGAGGSGGGEARLAVQQPQQRSHGHASHRHPNHPQQPQPPQQQMTLGQQLLAEQTMQRLNDETPEAFMLGPASGTTTGSSPLFTFTPLAMMLLEQGDPSGAAAAAGAGVSGGWAPLLGHSEVAAEAGAGAGDDGVAGAGAGACAAIAGGDAIGQQCQPPMPDEEQLNQALDAILTEGAVDFCIEDLLGSVPAIPPLAPASAATGGSPVVRLPAEAAGGSPLPESGASSQLELGPAGSGALPAAAPAAAATATATAATGQPVRISPAPVVVALSAAAAAGSSVVCNSMGPAPTLGRDGSGSQQAAACQQPCHPAQKHSQCKEPAKPLQLSPALAASIAGMVHGSGGGSTAATSGGNSCVGVGAGGSLPRVGLSPNSPLHLCLMSPGALAAWFPA